MAVWCLFCDSDCVCCWCD